MTKKIKIEVLYLPYNLSLLWHFLSVTPVGVGVYNPFPRRRTVSWELSISISRSQCGSPPQYLTRLSALSPRTDLCFVCVLLC